jgi:hypothetical protein
MKIGRKLLDGIDYLNEWSGKMFAFLSLLDNCHDIVNSFNCQ